MAKFRTRARAVDLLGKQQIRDEVTAISELLRNSYDADADVGLVDVNTNMDQIMVWDDGDGMTLEDINDTWLTLGTYSKTDGKNKVSEKGRVKIGEKGIGRLAISLLGDQLLVITKSKSIGHWSIMYLHWEFFRNKSIFLEDIVIPTESFETFFELINFFNNHFEKMKSALLSNFDNLADWDSNTVEKIKKDINSFTLPNEAVKQLEKNEKKGHGTLFHISSLDNTWEWSIYSSNIHDKNTKRRAQRLYDLLYSFQNLFELFGIGSKNSNLNKTDNFTPKIHINGRELEDESWFNPDDFMLYDYALTGKIKGGVFNGKALINGTNGRQEEVVENLKVTDGIYNPKEVECGPINIEWYFVEGDKSNSVLEKEDHKMMIDKLNNMGGIYVFRDGLRILPYGEPGNDFLYMEERRSMSAGTYLFSHRRMFGYIGISKDSNPDLVDKSSREGFIENQQYYYFRNTSMNLLISWATEILGTKYKSRGKRGKRNEELKRARENEIQRKEKKKIEDRAENKYLTDLNNLLDQFETRFINCCNEIENKLNRLLIADELHHNVNRLRQLNENISSLSNNAFDVINGLDNLEIVMNPRYEHSIELIDSIYTYNNRIQIKKEEYISQFEINLKVAFDPIYKEINRDNITPDDEDLQGKLIDKIDGAIYSYEKFILDEINNLEAYTENKTNNIIIELSKRVRKNVLKEINNHKEKIFIGFNKLEDNIHDLRLLKSKIGSFDFLLNEKDIYKEATLHLSEFDNEYNNARHELLTLIKKVNQSDKLKNTYSFLNEVVEKANYLEYIQYDQELIGMLKKEVSMHRDLSAVGLAAELTSHEFNALYQTINRNLKKLYNGLKNTQALPLLENTINGFQSLERLHQRMSPLYRQTRSRRTDINIHQFIHNTIEYFSSDIDRFEIKVINEVSENFVVRETETILFTPLINILSNAIYWLIDQDSREIHFYLNPEGSTLFVHDTGTGIKDNDENRIFEPYFTRRVDGRGLGLYLSRNLLESRGHSLEMVNPAEYIKNLTGACFCIHFNEKSIV